jgi:hypothetical protein
MAERDWIGLFSSGLSAVDRTHRLMQAWSAPRRRAEDAKAPGPRRPSDAKETLQVAHRILDALEGRSGRQGFFF